MSHAHGHKPVTQNHKAQLANAYNELGKELSSTKVRVVGNYTLGKVIGEGAYGKVRLGTHRLTSVRVAIKQIPKSMSAALTREIHHHRQLHHPHITQMYEVIATESSIWIVTELCCGGELFDYLVEKGRVVEEEAKIIFGQLCLAVAYLHQKGIVHRDLKLENVLLDERCRVKLGDFGFTREFERGSYMETFCGTTGYASPEMLQGKKYQGPEVDVWSLGVILYCLLTGMLPFDDDDERVMREKVILGEFDDPEWLSTESRNLIRDILQKDPSERLTIPQILAHPWFSTQTLPSDGSSQHILPQLSRPPSRSFSPERANSPEPQILECSASSEASTMSAASDATFLSASSEFQTSTPTTPESSNEDVFGGREETFSAHRNPSELTLRKTASDQSQNDPFIHKPGHQSGARGRQPETVIEEDTASLRSLPSMRNSVKSPPFFPVRTPARTKRRSVSSNLSETIPSANDKNVTPLPNQDFSSLLSTPSPIIFSTPVERELLNTLSMLGFDTGQMVHSVLSDACDAAGAVWWMMKRKAEKRAAEEADIAAERDDERKKKKEPKSPERKHRRRDAGIQTDPSVYTAAMALARSAPQLAFVPPSPKVLESMRVKTPPKSGSPTHPFLSPASVADRSHPSTPNGSVKDKDKDSSKGRREGKNRSGSVSIMQRATTALEAAGIVRKKSSDAVREEKDKEHSRSFERNIAQGDESRNSHSSGSSKLTKSPPLKPAKDHVSPSTPPSGEIHQPQPTIGSPWVMASHTYAPTPSNSPGDMPSLPGLGESIEKVGAGSHRNRASLLSAFRFWFNEDRKSKRKDRSLSTVPGLPYNGNALGPPSVNGQGTIKGRLAASGSGKFASRRSAHRQRHSVSSRRSSSVNSRRSSITSGQILPLESPHLTLEQVQTRRSFGSHTPNSERGEYVSRPSSIRSFQRHRKSPSASSAGSVHLRAASPMQKFHKRAGSGSSTRVVRQIQTPNIRPTHGRSNSTTSSIQSQPSSRPASFYEASENESGPMGSPFKLKTEETTPRRPSNSSTTFIAQKRQAPFMSPGHNASAGRTSWKKSWGVEPPGWQSRTAHLSIEILSMSPTSESSMSIRDVFSGRQSISLGDESDWVDEDDDTPAFAGGLGQMPASLSNTFASFGNHISERPVTLSPPPRGHRSAKRATLGPAVGSSSNSRQKAGHSPADRSSPIPEEPKHDSSDSRGARRQLPAARSGPAFRGHPIQEEDEGEEE